MWAIIQQCITNTYSTRPKPGEGLDAGEGRGAEEGWEGLDTGANF